METGWRIEECSTVCDTPDIPGPQNPLCQNPQKLSLQEASEHTDLPLGHGNSCSQRDSEPKLNHRHNANLGGSLRHHRCLQTLSARWDC